MRFKGKQPIFNRKDTWDLKSTLSPVILAGLEKFKEVISGDIAFKGIPHSFYEEGLGDGGWANWMEALDKMIFAFSHLDGEVEYDKDLGLDREDFFETEQTPDQEKNWEEYLELRKELHAKVQEGLDLFGKHYTSLWW